MRVLIVGYGRMGREVETILTDRGHTVSARVDRTPGIGDSTEISSELLRASDVAIEFSLPEGVVDNVRKYAGAGLPAVLGTTGWDAHRDEVKKIVEGYQSALVWGYNFSIGAHLFLNLVSRASALIADLPEYDIMVTEWHHKMKKDSPSGTALTTAQTILDALPRKTEINSGRIDRAIQPQELHVASVRGGWVPGIHDVMIDSAADTVEIRHTVRNRTGLALGSVLAAEWVLKGDQGKPRQGLIPVETFAKEFFAKALG